VKENKRTQRRFLDRESLESTRIGCRRGHAAAVRLIRSFVFFVASAVALRAMADKRKMNWSFQGLEREDRAGRIHPSPKASEDRLPAVRFPMFGKTDEADVKADG